MSKIKIAVIGSCVSRDSFNSKFIRNYKELYQCVLTQNHMSMISLVSDPIPFSPPKLDGEITDFNKQILMTELTKGIWDSLKIKNPDYLILDFYPDVYFGVRKVGNSFITDKTWLFQKTPFYSTLDLHERYKLENDYEQYMLLWKKSVDVFMNRMKNEFPNIKMIINKIHFTDFYTTGDGESLKRISESGVYKQINVDETNQWLDAMYQYVEEHYDVACLEYDKEYISDQNHIWNFFYVHYTKDFYEDFTAKLVSTILDDLYSVKQQVLGSHVSVWKKLASKWKAIGKKQTGNLLKNATFNLGNAYWTYWQDSFKIKEPEKDAPSSHILSLKMRGLQKDMFRQVWSHAVEINTDGDQVYTLTFDVKIKKVDEVDSQKAVFSLRTFNKIDQVFQKYSVWHENIHLEDLPMLKDQKWRTCSYTFQPTKGKFLKVGPYLIRNGDISWRNIRLEYNGTIEQAAQAERLAENDQ